MFKYTKSAVDDSFDFIKRLIYAFQIGVQLVYIMFMTYRLIDGSGNKIINIILLAVSVFYILFQIITTREFYTQKQVSRKTVVRRVVKITKYAVYAYIITIAAISLIGGTAENQNATMLITVLMLLGVLACAVFDVILLLIDKQAALVKSALLIDIEKFRIEHGIATAAIKKIGVDTEKMFPVVSDEKAIKNVKDVNYKQEQKRMRRRDFKRSSNKQ